MYFESHESFVKSVRECKAKNACAFLTKKVYRYKIRNLKKEYKARLQQNKKWCAYIESKSKQNEDMALVYLSQYNTMNI